MPSCQKLSSDEESRSRAAAAGRQQGSDSPLYARVRLSPRRAAACTRPSRPPTSTRLRATLALGRNATSGQAHLAPAPPGDLTLSDSEGDATEPLSLDNTLWAGTVLASGEALALVLYTGTDTRGAMNSAPPRSKAGSALAKEWWWWWCELSPTQRRSQVASVDLQVNLLAKALPLKHAPTSQPLTRAAALQRCSLVSRRRPRWRWSPCPSSSGPPPRGWRAPRCRSSCCRRWSDACAGPNERGTADPSQRRASPAGAARLLPLPAPLLLHHPDLPARRARHGRARSAAEAPRSRVTRGAALTRRSSSTSCR